MKATRMYLWKEWREQRAGVLWLLGVLPLLPLLAHGVRRNELLDAPLLPGVGAGAGALAALLVLGTQLIPGELGTGGIGFLERVPGSLHRAFFAKLSVLGLALVGFAVYGFAIAEIVQQLRGGPVLGTGAIDWEAVLICFVPVLAGALWIFAVTPWVPNGPLAVPTGLICATVLCWPGRWLFDSDVPYFPAPWELDAFVGLSCLAAVLSGWAAFAFGLRLGASRGRTASIGLGVAALAVSPMWAWGAYLNHLATCVDPHAAGFRIVGAYCSLDGSEALVWSRNHGAERGAYGFHHQLPPLIVDLRVGTHRVRQEPEGYPPEGFGYLDSSAGRLSDAWASMLPDGARVRPVALGLGYEVLFGMVPAGFFDRSGQRYFPIEELPFSLPRPRSLFMLPAGWLVSDTGDPPGWSWLDPDSGAKRPAEALDADDHIVSALLDGSLLVQRGTELLRLDLAGESFDPIAQRGGVASAEDPLRHATRLSTPMAVDSSSVLRDGQRYARYDPVRGIVEWHEQPDFHFQEYIDASSALIVARERVLERLDLVTGERTVLFPRE